MCSLVWNHCRFCFRYMIAPSQRELFNLCRKINIFETFLTSGKMYDQPTHPYVCLNWNKATRLKTFLPTSISCLSSWEKSTLIQNRDISFSRFKETMAKSMMYDFAQANGERALGLSITDKALQSIYFTTFCVTESGDLFIGCIQGARGSIEDRSDIIKSLTKLNTECAPKPLLLN